MRHDEGPLANDYLWDPSAPVDEEVAAVERALAPLRFEGTELPDLGSARWSGNPKHRRWMAAAVAAVALSGVLAALVIHRWSWPAGRAWPIATAAGLPDRLEVGRPLRLGPAQRARVSVARIGAMEVEPGSEITLRSTASNRHRVVLTQGVVRVRVWAPPGTVTFKTPAGDLVDLGCAFRLAVDPQGRAHVSVESGWVELEGAEGESLVPAGASSTMAVDERPRAPVFDDAAPAFREGVRALESRLDEGAAAPPLTFLAGARRKDAMTLLLVAKDAPSGVARLLLERAAALQPPPPDVTIDAILAGDRAPLWRWHAALDLPPPKGWWRNWRDAFR